MNFLGTQGVQQMSQYVYSVACSAIFKISAEFQCAVQSHYVIAQPQLKDTRVLL